jgi:hypothetical protein
MHYLQSSEQVAGYVATIREVDALLDPAQGTCAKRKQHYDALERKLLVAGGKAKGGKGQAKEGTYADFEKALKVGEKLTFEAKDGVLTEVKITGMGKGKGKGKAND